MKTNPQIIEALNNVLLGELTAINQYFLHAKMCKNWGYGKLCSVMHDHSIGEMKHAATITDRILFLEGVPNLQRLGKLNIGESVEEQLKSDLQLETEAVENLKKALQLCQKFEDLGSSELLESILVDEEKHIEWIETQLKLIGTLGKQLYLAQQV